MAALSRRRLTNKERKEEGGRREGQKGKGKSAEAGIEEKKEGSGRTCSLVMMTNQRPAGPWASPRLATGERELRSSIGEPHTLSPGGFCSNA